MPPPPPADAAITAPDRARSALGGPSRSVGAVAFWRKLAAFSGPGFLVAVGYMDPGNWATGIAAGSAYGYQLLCVVLLSNFAAMFLQGLAAKLGIVTGLDLARACGERYALPTRIVLWLLCEVAIIACDVAEVIGAAIALKLLFHLPLALGVGLTSLDVLLILGLQSRGFRLLQAIVISLIAVIAACFASELAFAHPQLAAVAAGAVPTPSLFSDPAMLYLAIAMLGATVMPHNLYLHSSAVRPPREAGEAGKREAIRFARLDTAIALGVAIFVNAAIVVLAAAAFHSRGSVAAVGIEDAYRLLSPTLGVGAASTLFAVALLASGQNATFTGTLAGQIVMEGFTGLRAPAWARRLVSRLVAIIPAGGVVLALGDSGAAKLLILSQVVLSLQLPFAVYPLVRLTNSRSLMGRFANRGVAKVAAWALTGMIVVLNVALIAEMLAGRTGA